MKSGKWTLNKKRNSSSKTYTQHRQSIKEYEYTKKYIQQQEAAQSGEADVYLCDINKHLSIHPYSRIWLEERSAI